MREFKEHDVIRIKKGCDKYLEGEELKVCKYSWGGLYVTGPFGARYHWVCSDETHWQLVEPKERTIEDVRVGDMISPPGELYSYQVFEKTENLVAIRNFGDIDLTWRVTKELKGWTIKQPEPENGAAEKQWLEIGKRNGWNSKCCYGSEDCPKCK